MQIISIPSEAVVTERFATEAEAIDRITHLNDAADSLWVRRWFGGVSAIRAEREKPWVVQYIAGHVIPARDALSGIDPELDRMESAARGEVDPDFRDVWVDKDGNPSGMYGRCRDRCTMPSPCACDDRS